MATPTASALPEVPLVLHLPGDPSYVEAVTPWNAAVEVRPAAVVRASTASEVAAAVRHAADHGLRVAVQCTGHGAVAGIGQDVLLLDTSGLDEVRVSDGTVRVGAGVRWQQVVDAAAPYGLAPLNASSLGVGVVGYLTGGGLGPMARTFGWASDRVTALDLVTADGEQRRVTPTENPDLFWGLRGGKGALGIVTAVELDLVPVVSLYGGAAWFAGEDAGVVLERWRRWTADLPEEATSSVALVRAPWVPDALGGRLGVAVRFAHVGDAAEGEALFAPVRSTEGLVLDRVGVIPYAAVGAIHGDPVDPTPLVERAMLLARLDGETVDRLLAVAGPGSGSSLVVVEVRHLGGAVARPGPHPSAVAHRDAAYSVVCVGPGGPGVGAESVTRAEAVLTALRPWAHAGMLANFGHGGALAYDTATLARLRELMALHDPVGLLVAGDPLR